MLNVNVSATFEVPLVAALFTVNTSYKSTNIASKDNYLFVADEERGLQVYGVSSNKSLTLDGNYTSSGMINNLAVNGDYIYATYGNGGVKILDIASSPTAPTMTGSYNSDGDAYAVAINNNELYLADKGKGINVLDITDKSNLSSLRSSDTPENIWDVEYKDGYIFMANADSDLNITNSNLENIGNYNFENNGCCTGGTKKITIDDNYAYLSSRKDGMVIVNITDPTNPTREGNVTVTTNDNMLDIGVVDNYAITINGTSGIYLFDISNKKAPSLYKTYKTAQANGMFISGGYLYIADYDGGIKIYKINTNE